MVITQTGTPLPSGTMIYQEYEGWLNDDKRVVISVTLSNLWDESDRAAGARAIGARAFGYIIAFSGAGRLPLMRWSWDGAEIQILEEHAGQSLGGEMRRAISDSVLHFFASMEYELRSPSPVVH